jgi:hypothetical protein
MGEQYYEAIDPHPIQISELAIELPHSLAPLRLGFCINQIGDRFGLGKIEFSMFKGTSSEFAGFSQTETVQSSERTDNGSNNPTPTMEM